ncbi:MAG: KH domain-containing protein [Verrucomicrobia bacterium]|nr:KH domain-containing protein [Verrucomicrobiota bacterium]
MDEFIAYIVKNLVEHPEEVRVDMRDVDGRLFIEVRAASEDLSRVIGRGGRTIQAIRTIAATAAARHSCRVRIDVIDEEQEPEATPPAEADADASFEEEV